MKFIGVIPARYDSSRFPGKPLAMIDGKSMVMRVFEQASKASCFFDVVVATDDQRIYDHVLDHGGKVIMTTAEHQSGTDRVFEAVMKIIGRDQELKNYVAINIQGDEPYIEHSEIDRLANCFSRPEIGIATLVKKIEDESELFDPNTVKAIIGKDRQALYFSRSALPYVRNKNSANWLSAFSFYKHIGIYAYRADILKSITALEPSPLEIAEGLEQLRWLENGFLVYAEVTDYESKSVDTPEDLLKLTNKI